jgi:serine/threonine-protein kinase
MSSGEHEKIRSLGKYQIVKRLGAGGMGAVFLATDTELKRAVALKVLPKDRAENPTLVRRFKAEAQAVAQLRHDNIVSIYDTGQIEGFPYIALEFVDGNDLLTVIEKRGPIPPKRSLKIIRQVADALQHAFNKNIIHRDIKPSNLLVQVNGTAKITDFGLARSVDETLDTSITRAGTTVGTVDYISPEQACDSKAADIRSDIYSLGCTWYQMVTGKPPFPDGNMQDKLRGHINSPPPNPRQLNANVPEAYVAVMHRMMAKRPQDRYQTPAELLRDLDQVAGAVSSLNAELFDEPTSGGGYDDEADEHPKARSGQSKSAKPKSKAPSAEKPSKRESPSDDSPPSKINEKWRGRGGPVRRPTATRGLGAADADLEAGDVAEDDEVGTARKSKKLPPRSRSEPGGFAIDLDFARIALIGAIVAGAIGLFWWAFSRGGSWTPSNGGKGEVAVAPGPDANATPQAAPQFNPDAPVAPQVRQPSATAVVAALPDVPAATVVEAGPLAGDAKEVDRSNQTFPGLEGIEDLKSAAAKDLVPDWVIALRKVDTSGVTPVVVESPPRLGTEASIDAALQRTAGKQRVIELKGPGPFLLRPVVVQGCEHLLIRAAEGSDPLVLLAGVPDATRGHGHLQVDGGVLELRKIHMVARVSTAVESTAIFKATGGTVALRDCSITVPGESSATLVTRAEDSSKRAFASRVLLENCLIRGARATAASVSGSRSEIVVGGCLLANESGPLIEAQLAAAAPKPEPKPAAATSPDSAPLAKPAPSQPADKPAKAPAAPERALTVRLLSSVLWSNGEVLSLRQPVGDAVLRSSVRLRHSIAVSAGGDAATLLELPEWPSRSTTVSGQPRLAGLTWSQEQSWLAGWPTLIRLADEPVTEADGWSSFVGTPLETGAFDPAAALARSVELEQVTFDQMRDLQAKVPAEAASGAQVGVADSLPRPPAALIDKHLLLAGRPQMPVGFVELAAAAQVVKYDLKTLKRDLSELLGSAEVPDGAHVQFAGLGLVNLPPIHLQNKSLRIEFVQSAEGAPLTIRPEPAQGSVPEAWLVVEGGRLDLIGARIQASQSRTRESPLRLILARDCDLTIRQCSFDGPPGGDDVTQGLIDWVQSKPGDTRRHAYIANSQFVGGQPLFSADVDARLLQLENNLFAGRGDGVVLRSSVGAAPVPRVREGWVLLDHNTLLIGRYGLQFAGITTGRTSPAVRVLATANVFAPAPGSDATCLLRQSEGMTAQNLFDWWGRNNGYAPALKQFRRSAATIDPAVTQDFNADWKTFWTSEHEEASHVGLNGVMLETVLTSLQGIAPSLVLLSRNCTGISGAPDGTSLGIRADRVGPLGGVAAAGTTNPTASKVGGTGTGTQRPLANPGF